jgi:tRNA dimethylallyltransferase
VKLVALVGPTGAGKTEAGVALAEELGAEIISCDSIAVYRGCEIGAAKPSTAERARVRHHVLDVADPRERFNAVDWVRHADAALADITARGKVALIVGGTGLYLRALVDGIAEAAAPDLALRAQLRVDAARAGWPALHARLALVDAETAARVHPSDGVRIERALEVHALTGEPLSRWQARHRESGPRHELRAVVLDPGPALEERIATRTRAMLDAGLLDETRALATLGRDLKPLGALGYKEALAHLDGQLSADALPDAIRTATRRFARRQRNWFNGLKNAIHVSEKSQIPVEELARFR